MTKSRLSYHSLVEQDYERLNKQLEDSDSMEILKWAYQQFADELVYACSFGAEGIVLIDLINKIKKDAKVVFLDTHFHFKETYELIDKVKAKYPQLQISFLEPDFTPQEQAEHYGEELWKVNSDLCCKLRKIQPLEKALTGAAAWISGLRREQSPTRARTQLINQDHRFQSIKICPIIHWKWEDVWSYIKAFELPYNELHDRGYPSIGCENCTLPVGAGEDSRAGRWAQTRKTECGLHT